MGQSDENSNKFRAFLEKYSIIPDSDWLIIRNAFNRKVFSKNDIILAEGSICRYFYFLDEGLIRFFYNNDGEEITKFFTVAPYCFTSRSSFRNQKPADESIQAIERTVVWQSSFNKTNELLGLKSWEAFTRNFMHEVQTYTEELMLEIKTRTAEERYLRLLEKHPDLTHKIPLKYLSGFLGIAPQSLSRIRKKFL